MRLILKKIRQQILELSHKKKKGHIASAFSILEILYSIYTKKKQEDAFLLSKGHGCLALYGVFLHLKKISLDDFNSFCEYDSILGGHPDRNKIKGVECSAGSLGHGLPMAAGIALANKIDRKEGLVYCLIGDGESNEGTTWETAILAKNLNLSNLVCLVDNNNSQVRAISTENITSKFKSFGWHTILVENGHDLFEIYEALSSVSRNKPTCIVFNTVKGYGVKSMMNNMFEWHHKAPNEKELNMFIQELEDA